MWGDVENRKIRAPGSHRIRVLPGHGSDDLIDVAQVVCDPRRKMLPQRHRAEFRMQAAAREVGVGQPQRDEAIECSCPELLERVEELFERPAL